MKIWTMIIISSFLLTVGIPVYADLGGLTDTATKAGYKTEASDRNLGPRIGSVIGVILSLVGVIFLCLMLYGGFLWMTASGSKDQVHTAQDIIVAATIGIIIVLSAYAITGFFGQSFNFGSIKN